MKSWVFPAVFLAVFSSSYASFVYDLNAQNFEHMIKEKEIMLVDFFAPWCPHCKELTPIYENAANALAGKGLYEFAKVDCVDPNNKMLCDKYNVQGYPSIKLFKFGQYAGDYIGERTDTAIENYMDSVTSTSAQQQPLAIGGPKGSNFVSPFGPSAQQIVFNQPQPNQPMPFAQQATQPQAPGVVQPYAPQQPQAAAYNPYMGLGNDYQRPPAPAAPSLMGSFFNSPQQQPQAPPPMVSAYASNPASAQLPAPQVSPQANASPDSLAGRFGGNMLALEILRSKLKMIAAYKNWQSRLKEYKEKLAEAASGNRYGETKGSIAKKPASKGAPKSKLAHFKPAPTHFQQKFPRIMNSRLAKHKKEMEEYKRRAAAYTKAVEFRRQQIMRRQKQEAEEKYRKSLIASMHKHGTRAQAQMQRPLYQAPLQSRSMIQQPQFVAPQAQEQLLQAPQAQVSQARAQVPSSQEAVTVVQPEPETQDQTVSPQGDQPNSDSDKAAKNDDSPSMNDLRADIETAIKDALKNGDKGTTKASTSDDKESSGSPPQDTTADKTKAQETSGSGVGEVTVSSPGPKAAVKPADMSGSGAKETDSGSGSGDAHAQKNKTKRMAGES